MNRERITDLIRILRDPLSEVPDLIAFNMAYWGRMATLDECFYPEDFGQVFTDDRHKCGAVCCALGLAGLSPTFQAQGLSYDEKTGNFNVSGSDRQVNGFRAAERFFGLPAKLTERIFQNSHAWYDEHLDRGAATRSNIRPQDVVDILQMVLDGKITSMNTKRLRRLVDLLRRPPPPEIQGFDLAAWSKPLEPSYDPDQYAELFPLTPGNECGSVVCACGLAAITPEFQADDFTLDPVGGGPCFKDACGWQAVERYFDLSVDEAVHLFCVTRYPDPATREHVACRIEKFIATA